MIQVQLIFCGLLMQLLSEVVVVQLLSFVWPFATPRTATRQASLSFTVFQTLLRLMFTESVMPTNHLILCHPLLLLPSIFLNIRVFSNELALRIRWSKCWSFSSSISLSDEHSGLINWFDLLAVQEILQSLLQHHNFKASILQWSTFFMVQLSYPYTTTGKTITLTNGPLSAKWCLCFLTHCLGLS